MCAIRYSHGANLRWVLQLAQVLISLQKNILRQIQSIFPVFDQPQQIVEDPLFPPGDKEVIGLHVVAAGLSYQVAVLNLPKNQLVGSVSNDVLHMEKDETYIVGRGNVTIFTHKSLPCCPFFGSVLGRVHRWPALRRVEATAALSFCEGYSPIRRSR